MNNLDYIRQRPGMYLCNPDDPARDPLTLLIEILVANSLHQFAQGFGRTVQVSLHEDGSCIVEDEGPGISLEPSESLEGLSELEACFSRFRTPDGNARHSWKHEGDNGVGTLATNAVCSRFEIDSYHGGKHGRIVFQEGKVVEPLLIKRNRETRTGLAIRFFPDPTIFTLGTRFVRPRVSARLRELAMNAPGSTIVFSDRLGDTKFKETISYPRGIADYLEEMIAAEPPTDWPPMQIAGHGITAGHMQPAEFSFEIVATYVENLDWRMVSYAHAHRCIEHGNHVDGFISGMLQAVDEALPGVKYSPRPKKGLKVAQLLPGLRAIVMLRISNPRYDGAWKRKIINEVTEPIRKATYLAASQYLAEHPLIVERIVQDKPPY